MIIIREKQKISEAGWLPAKPIDAMNYFSHAQNDKKAILVTVGETGCYLVTRMLVSTKGTTAGGVNLIGVSGVDSFAILYNNIASVSVQKDSSGAMIKLLIIFKNKLRAEFVTIL